MKIKELEELTGIPRANIRFYEKEGMLSPDRAENGYREYSDEDKEVLLRIKLLRSLDVSLDDIKALQQGENKLSAVLENHLNYLEEKKTDISNSQRVCREIYIDNAEFYNLDATKYINSFSQTPIPAKEEDVLPLVRIPIRRFLARELDFITYLAISSLILSICNVNIFKGERLITLLITIMAVALTLLVEPLLLRLFGTTLGKWFFGIYVYDESGSKLPYITGFVRTGSVLLHGVGYYIPIYSWIRLWKCYQICDDFANDDPLDWEYESELQFKKGFFLKPYIGVAVIAGLYIGLVLLGGAIAQIPKYRGDITIAQFAENYNRLDKYLFDYRTHKLGSDGRWVKNFSEMQYGYVYYGAYSDNISNFDYKLDEKGLYEISIKYETDINWVRDIREVMLVSANSFACTEKNYSLNSENRKALFELIENNPHSSFSYSSDGITVDCAVEYDGYLDYGIDQGILFAEDGKLQSYLLTFTITKER